MSLMQYRSLQSQGPNQTPFTKTVILPRRTLELLVGLFVLLCDFSVLKGYLGITHITR